MFAFPPLRFTLLAGTFTFLLLGIFAVIFYQERVIFIDIAFQLFHTLKDGTYAIQHNRTGAFLTMSFPLLASKLGLPLKLVMLSYSVGFVVYYFAIFLLITAWLKNYRLGLVLLFFCTLFVSDTFYWPISELPQGIAFLLLIFAFIQRYHNFNQYNVPLITAFFLMLVCVTYFHPLLIIPLVFLASFFYLTEHRSENKTLLIATVVIFIALTFFKTILKPAGYDSTAMGNVNNIFKLFPNYFDLQSNKDFIKFCLTDFYFIPVVFLINTIHYIRTKKYLSLAIFLAFFFGYLFLVNVSYYAGTHQFYIENLYLPLGLILAVPFVYDFLPSLRNQKLAFGIILAMLLIRVVHIGLSHEKFTARLNWHKKLLGDTAQLPNKKLLINAAEVPIDTLFMTWCTSYELLLLSAIDKPEDARLIQIDEEPHRYDWQLYMNKAFLTEWKEVEFKDLPHRYFNPTDTSQYIHYSLKP